MTFTPGSVTKMMKVAGGVAQVFAAETDELEAKGDPEDSALGTEVVAAWEVVVEGAGACKNTPGASGNELIVAVACDVVCVMAEADVVDDADVVDE